MRRVLNAPRNLVLGALLILVGAVIAVEPAATETQSKFPSDVPKPGEEGNVGAPELSSELLGVRGVDPKKIAQALDGVAGPHPDVSASIGDPHAAALYRRLAPLVVLIVTDDGVGSGSIISADGDVLTSNHMILGYDQVAVILKPAAEGAAPSEFDALTADVVKIDQVADLALIRIRDWKESAFIGLGDADAISVGDDVNTIGHPQGKTWTYTKGVISQMRNGYGWTYRNEFDHQADVIGIQAPIDPGNSGGPLLDDDGRLIGVNSDGQMQDLSFAISVREVDRFLNESQSRYAESFAPPSEEEECGPLVTFTGRNDANNADIRMTDNDCDDYPEMVEQWFDDPNLGYAVEFDKDRDGKWEAVVVDSDTDGTWDYSLYDTNADGAPDLRGLHPDGGWRPSEYVRV
ncbi:MAG: S1C family serine protease [Dongiaceae bacterium]